MRVVTLQTRARQSWPIMGTVRSRDAFVYSQITGVLLGDKSVVGKVRLLLTDASRIWVESNVLLMSSCHLRWPRFPAATKSNLLSSVGKNASITQFLTDKAIQLCQAQRLPAAGTTFKGSIHRQRHETRTATDLPP